MPLDFAPENLPWLDRQSPDIDGYVKALGKHDDDLRAQLAHWSQFGFIRMPGLIDHDLIFPPQAFARHHLRLMELHNLSGACKALSLHPAIVEFLGNVFRDTVVAMQSLTFKYSTEQSTHQDFAYVRS